MRLFLFLFCKTRAHLFVLFFFRASSRRVASEWSDGAPKQTRGVFVLVRERTDGEEERLVRDETETHASLDDGMKRQELETELDVESGSVEDVDDEEEVEVGEEEEANPREIGVGTFEGVKRRSAMRDVARLFLSPYDEMDVDAVVVLSESDETNEGERHVVISDERFVNDTFCIGCGRRATANLSRRIDHVVACDALAMKMCNLIRVGDVGETVERYLRLVALRAGNGRTCKMDALERLHQVCALMRALAWTRD